MCCPSSLKKHKETGNVEDRRRSGRPRKLTAADERHIMLTSLRNRKMSSSAISSELAENSGNLVHPSTVRRSLVRSGLHGRHAAKKPYLRCGNKAKRLNYARKHRNWGAEKWQQVLTSAILIQKMSKSLKKIVEESREKNLTEVDMCDRSISNMLDISGLYTLSNITQLVLSHNKLTTVPPNIADLKNLEVLNFFNNQIEELPTQLSSLQKLKHLNLGMNRLNSLPRGFGSLPGLEVLDLTYNNLNESSLPGNFFYLTTLRALYLSDNDFEILPPDIGKLTKLQILSLRDNDLISMPKEIGDLSQLKELHIQGNRLTVLPPELGNLDLTGPKQVFKAENNPWVTPIADQFQLGVSHVFEYVRSETYKYLYGRHMQANPEPPKKNSDKTKKISRKPLAAKNK
ncbi:ras suppressor protein 1 isoform X1 [Acipenser oxyrinchus oxyrinchus]|uniref:Ras suppressor protein 1 n=2 Tax=Acipenseridae TaxID=7900 RepID=A0AAD8GD21_ACIOX|nr:ras suppressor protein 1 isoform X1 [Acipenser oxyrinchus oxyrinchus]